MRSPTTSRHFRSANGGRHLQYRMFERNARRGWRRERARGVRAGELLWAPLVDDALEGLRVEKRIVTVPLAHATRRTLGRVRATEHGTLARIVRRAALHRLDGAAAAARHPGHDDPRPRAAPLPGQAPSADGAHAHAHGEGDSGCDLVFTNSEFTASDIVERLGLARERLRVAYPGVDDAYTPEGERHDLGRPYVFTTATEDWRKNRSVVERAIALLDGDLTLVSLGQDRSGFVSPRSCRRFIAAPRSSRTRRGSRALGCR